MRYLVLSVMVAGLWVSGYGQQNPDRGAEADAVRSAVGIIGANRKPFAEIVTRDLRELRGKIVGVYPDSFLLKITEKDKALVSIGNKRSRAPMSIKYTSVLQIESRKIALSFVPDSRQRPFSSWEGLKDFGVGELLQVETKDQKRIVGVFMRISSDRLELMRGNTALAITRSDVAAIFRVAGYRNSVSSKVLKGAGKGTEITDDILPIFDPAARANPAALGIGAGVGALVYLLPKAGAKRVLVFSQ